MTPKAPPGLKKPEKFERLFFEIGNLSLQYLIKLWGRILVDIPTAMPSAPNKGSREFYREEKRFPDSLSLITFREFVSSGLKELPLLGG
ncbi:MAG: hypothetical protein Ct9H90mP8_1670 [Pseudomonadota bacterium]|nr:MAG: hypothetical protein Ct9H90mP8_1670 [Pseudomonadota bacterium]